MEGLPVDLPSEDDLDEIGNGHMNRLPDVQHAILQGRTCLSTHPGGAEMRPPPITEEAEHMRIPSLAAPAAQHAQTHWDKRSAATLKLGSLNMRGGGQHHHTQPNEKWLRINQLMREQKIAILAVQETHLNDASATLINNLFSTRIHLIHSAPTDRATSSKGVAFVLNKEKLHMDSVTTVEIIPGRALLLNLTWHRTVQTTILTVYAPNQPHDNALFWEELGTLWESQSLPRPSVILGDFNIVEDALDRLPHHADNLVAVRALQKFYHQFDLYDGWRTTFPSTKGFTFSQPNAGSQSRIDRIYVSQRWLEYSYDWTHESIPTLSTDHLLTSTTLSDRALPFVGKGRWTIPKCVTHDRQFLSNVMDLGMSLQEKLDSNAPDDNSSPLDLYLEFKETLLRLARDTAKTKIPKIKRKIDTLKSRLSEVLNEDRGDVDVSSTLAEAATIQDHIQHLERLRFNSSRRTIAAQNWTHGETISKPWVSQSKTKKPRDVLLSLRKPDTEPTHHHPNPTSNPTPSYATRSNEMAQLAGEYFDNLQADGLDSIPPARRELLIAEALASVTTSIPAQAMHSLAAHIDSAELSESLKLSKNDKATGLDGIPYELWKELHLMSENDRKDDIPSSII